MPPIRVDRWDYEEADDAPPAAPPRRRAGVLTAVLAVVFLAVLGGGVVYHFRQLEQERRAELARREEAIAQQAALDRAIAAREARRAAPVALPDLMKLIPAAPLGPDEFGTRTAALRHQLLGVWRGPGPDGGTREVEYRGDGTFRDAVTGSPADRTWAGTWAVEKMTGGRTLRLTRSAGPAVVRLAVEGDELVHDDVPGRATVLRRE